MENGRTTRTTYDIALLPTYTHYHTLYTHEVRVRNQIPPPLFFPLQPPHPTSSPARTSLSHTHKQKRQLCAPPACPRPPCLPPTDKTDRVRRSRSFTRHKPIFHRGLSFGGFAPLGEEEPLPGLTPACLTYTPPPEPERIYGKKKSCVIVVVDVGLLTQARRGGRTGSTALASKSFFFPLFSPLAIISSERGAMMMMIRRIRLHDD